MDQARTLLTNVTLRGRLGLAASALGVLVVGLLLFRLASAPSYTLLTTGLDPAQARLALPTQDVFAETQRPPTAAVLLAGSADGLDAASVRGIARLVASSVEGLKPSNVTIADGAGQLLWPAAGAGDGGAAASATA